MGSIHDCASGLASLLKITISEEKELAMKVANHSKSSETSGRF